MAGINWTSSSIQSFFKTSLNQNTSGMNGLYGLLGDKALIKSGSYHKLMDAYVKKVKSEKNEESQKTNTEKDKKAKTEAESDSKVKATKENTVTYDNSGIKSSKPSTDSIIDTLI